VISTIPFSGWISLLSPRGPAPVVEAVSRLAYRHMVFVYLLLSRERVSQETWIYVPSARFRVCRIHEPKNWSEALVPRGKTSLCAELFASRDGDLWKMDDSALVDLVMTELRELGLMDPKWVLDSRVERVTHTHPVYRMGFQTALGTIHGFLREEMCNFHLLGRTGAFQYKNMDQVMVDGFRLGERLERALLSQKGREGGLPEICPSAACSAEGPTRGNQPPRRT
jgi:protoporphyrinogen oxidase